MIVLVPNSFGSPLHEVNHCHTKGSKGHPCAGGGAWLAREAKGYETPAAFEEALRKQGRLFYHSTNSPEPFDTFEPKVAAKGEKDQYYNPLGTGVYVSSNPEFSKSFGRYTYQYVLPKGAKIKTITAESWRTRELPVILNKLQKVAPLPNNEQTRYYLQQIRNDGEPISALNELHELYVIDGRASASILKVMDERYAKYDAIRFTTTNYYNVADEMVIRPAGFTKGRMLRSVDALFPKRVRRGAFIPHRRVYGHEDGQRWAGL